MKALDIIQRLGGVMQVARDLGVSFTTVSSWGRVNQIPEWRQGKLLELASRKSLPLSTADFPPLSERVSRSEPKADAA